MKRKLEKIKEGVKIIISRFSLPLVNSAGVEPTTSWAVTKCSIH